MPIPVPPGAGDAKSRPSWPKCVVSYARQETIEAIRSGGVDSLMIGAPGEEQVYALASVDRTYQLIVKAMNEGAATVSPRGVILDANPRLGSMTGQTGSGLVGTAVLDLIPEVHVPRSPA